MGAGHYADGTTGNRRSWVVMSEPPDVRTLRTQGKTTQQPQDGESDEDEEKEIRELLRHAKEQSRRCNKEEDERRKLEADQMEEALELSRLAYEQENQRHPVTPPLFYPPRTPTRGDHDWAGYANDSFDGRRTWCGDSAGHHQGARRRRI